MNFPRRLLEGYHAFRAERLAIEQSRYRELALNGQHPEIMIIGCCDSRVSPEVIYDAHPGELFVVRNVANLVPPYSPSGLIHGVSAALEFAVQALKVKHIVVLGHARCGGIRAFAEHEKPLSKGDFIGHWMSLVSPAAKAVGERGKRPMAEYLTLLEQASTLATLGNLRTFPFVQKHIARGELELHASYFDVANGMLSVYDPLAGVFTPADGPLMGSGEES